MSDHDAIRDAAFVAAMWDAPSDDLRRLVEQDPGAALTGFTEAAEREEDRIWALLVHLEFFSLEELEAAHAPEAAIARKRIITEQQQSEEQMPPDHRAGPERFAGAIPDRRATRIREERKPPPTLSELLARDRETLDEIIAHNSQQFASQVASLAADEADDLRGRLDDWWPDKPYAETITRKDANSWSQENRAAAWLWFGPPLDKDVSPFQWAELVSCGVLFHDQTEWLQRKSSEDGKLELARVCVASDSRNWHQALEATPDPLPQVLVDAIVANLRAVEQPYSVRYIGERLDQAAGQAPLRVLSEVSDAFAAVLRPILAADGDEDAQRLLAHELLERLEKRERPGRDQLAWLDTVTSEDLLDDLFACVELVYGSTEFAADEGAGWFSGDVLTPVMNAIRNIGGRAAVERYDRLITEKPGFQFLRSQRQAVVQSILQHDGLEAAEGAARELGLPYFAGPDHR